MIVFINFWHHICVADIAACVTTNFYKNKSTSATGSVQAFYNELTAIVQIELMI